jgi:Mn-dependent DtxR family transcriptional regulator
MPSIKLSNSMRKDEMKGTCMWIILEYMRKRNAFGRSEEEFVSRKELIEALGVKPNTLNKTLYRMKNNNWVVGYPKKHYSRYYCLGSRALSFLRKHPDFIHHEYFAGFQE